VLFAEKWMELEIIILSEHLWKLGEEEVVQTKPKARSWK
jgi:hypothetical protein